MAKVRDNQTGQIFEVPDNQLGQYGLAPSVASIAQPVSQSPMPQQNTDVMGQIGNFLINLAKSAVKPTTDTVKDIVKNPQNYQKNAADYIGALGGPLGELLAGGNQAKKLLPAELNTASFVTPFSPEAGIIKGAVLPGAAVGAMQRSSEPGANVSNVLGSGVTGGLTAGALQGILNIASKTAGKVGSLGQKIEDTGSSVRQGVSKVYLPANVAGASKEKAVLNTLDELGIAGNAQQKYEQLLPAMKGLESDIGKLTENATNTVPVGDIKDSFVSNLKPSLLSKDLTNSQVTSEVNGFLKDLNRMSGGTGKFTNVDAQTLLNWKRLINESYQPIAKKLETGGALTAREKVINVAWKAIDDAMGKNYPEVADLLTKQSNLYKAAPSLSAARKTVPTFRMFGTTVPSSVQQSIQDTAGKTLQNVGGNLQSAQGIGQGISTMSPTLAKLLTLGVTVGAGNMGNNGQNSNTNTYPNTSQYNPSGNIDHTNNYTPQNQQQTGELTPQMVQAAQLYLPAPIAARVKAAYEAQYGGATTQQVGLVRAGLKNVGDVQQMLQEDPNLLTKQLLPGKLASRKFDSAIYDAADALLRLRTGAQANPSEIKAYAKTIAPSFGDTPDVITYKLNKLRSDLQSYLGQ